jgi:glycosyltransferase involved in cell wall biosynthesis
MSRRRRLAILTSHPIQYNAPLFRCLSHHSEMECKVFYSWEGNVTQLDPEFNRSIVWDIPLLEGYKYEFVKNIARKPGSGHFFGLNNPTMNSTIEQWSADAILVYGWNNLTNLRALRYFSKKIPVVFRGDSTQLNATHGIKNMLRDRILRYVYSKVDMALYPGQHSKGYFKRAGLSADQLYYVPHCIENERFSQDSQDVVDAASKLRSQLGIASDATVFLFAGKLVSRKNPLLLMSAFNQLVANHEQAELHLVYVGAGELQKNLSDLSNGQNNVHLLGFKNQSEMPSIYRLGDIYVLPSTIETWGLGVNEAMACGLPAIISDFVGCGPELIDQGKTGFVFEEGSVNALESAMATFVTDPQLANNMKSNVAEKIEQHSLLNAALAIESACQACWKD